MRGRRIPAGRVPGIDDTPIEIHRVRRSILHVEDIDRSKLGHVERVRNTVVNNEKFGSFGLRDQGGDTGVVCRAGCLELLMRNRLGIVDSVLELLAVRG